MIRKKAYSREEGQGMIPQVAVGGQERFSIFQSRCFADALGTTMFSIHRKQQKSSSSLYNNDMTDGGPVIRGQGGG